MWSPWNFIFKSTERWGFQNIINVLMFFDMHVEETLMEIVRDLLISLLSWLELLLTPCFQILCSQNLYKTECRTCYKRALVQQLFGNVLKKRSALSHSWLIFSQLKERSQASLGREEKVKWRKMSTLFISFKCQVRSIFVFAASQGSYVSWKPLNFSSPISWPESIWNPYHHSYVVWHQQNSLTLYFASPVCLNAQFVRSACQVVVWQIII